MNEIIVMLIISVVLASLFELLLPEGSIKKVAVSIAGVIVLCVAISPVIDIYNAVKNGNLKEYFSDLGEEIHYE